MSESIVSVNEESLRLDIKELVKNTVRDVINQLLEEEADELVNAGRYERTAGREAYRSGHCKRKLVTSAGEVELDVPKLRGATFQTAVIERYRRRETSVEEAIIEMCLAGVSTRRIEDVSQILWGAGVSAGTVSNLNDKAFASVEEWGNRPLEGEYPYVFVDGACLKRSWGGAYENVSVMVAIGVNGDGDREVIGCAEGFAESKDSWKEFLLWLRGRGLSGVRMVTGDKSLGMLGALEEVFPQAKYRRCTVHFYRNVFGKVPRSKRERVAKMLKAIHAQESLEASMAKAESVAADLEAMKLDAAAKVVREGCAETPACTAFPMSHWVRIRTNNAIERLNRGTRRRTGAVGTFPDGKSALMPVTARLKHVAESEWGSRRYLDVSMPKEVEAQKTSPLRRWLTWVRLKICERSLTVPKRSAALALTSLSCLHRKSTGISMPPIP